MVSTDTTDIKDTTDEEKAAKATAIQYTQHVFGRFGQGANALVDNVLPVAYSYQDPASATSKLHGIMVSIFPSVIGTTELLAAATSTTTAKTIVIEASAVNWISRSTWYNAVAPTQPTAAVDPDTEGAHKALMLGSAAVAVVVASVC